MMPLSRTKPRLSPTKWRRRSRSTVMHATATGDVLWAYEIDGYGNTLLMDDANAPGLLSLPYLGCCAISDPVYQRTRAWVLSLRQSILLPRQSGEGVGGPHQGLNYIWPMSILFRAFTSTDDQEIRTCLRTLRDTTAGTHFLHESFQKDDAADFTRAWFAWANTLFGELILHLAETRPAILSSTAVSRSLRCPKHAE